MFVRVAVEWRHPFEGREGLDVVAVSGQGIVVVVVVPIQHVPYDTRFPCFVSSKHFRVPRNQHVFANTPLVPPRNVEP